MRHFLLIPTNGFYDRLKQSQRQSRNTNARDSLSDYIISVCLKFMVVFVCFTTDVGKNRTQAVEVCGINRETG